MTAFWEKIQDRQWRKQWIRYWLQDPFWGGLDYGCHYLFRLLPLNVPAKIGAFLGPLAAHSRFKTAHSRAATNLQILRPDLSESQQKILLHKMWQNIGQTLSEYSIADLLWQAGRIAVKDDHFIKEAQQQDLPIIFVTVHLTNWEIISSYCIDNAISLLSLYQPEKNRFVTQLAENSRRKRGTKTVAAGSNALREMCKHLQNGGALWFAIDEYKNGQVLGPQLGRKTEINATNAAYAVRLAQRFNAVIIPYQTERHANSHFTVTFSQSLRVHNNSAEVLSQLDELMASWILKRPEDWYMLHVLRL
jgi:KDO2-lipid IV(A) lauroyltransferase